VPATGPLVVVGAVSADVDLHVDRRAAAEPLAAGNEDRAVVQLSLGLREEAPVVPTTQELRPGGGDAHVSVQPGGTRLEEQRAHAGVLGQPVGEHAAGRAGADDDVVVAVHAASLRGAGRGGCRDAHLISWTRSFRMSLTGMTVAARGRAGMTP